MPTPSSFTTLGTGGGPMQNPQRSQPAHLLMVKETPVLVDCGEGALRQLRCAGIDYRQVDHIFLSHHHFDHIGSLFACLGLNMMIHRHRMLTIYGPPGTRQIVDGLIAACAVPHEAGFGATDQKLPNPVDFVEVREMTPADTIELDGCRVTCCENTHYRPESEAGQPGHLSLSFRFDLEDRSIVFTGDTGPCEAVERLAQGVDLLVGEMVDAEKVIERFRKMNPNAPKERADRILRHMTEHHLTAEQLGDIAARSGAGCVVAVHLTNDSVTPETAEDYLSRIRSRFEGEVHLGEDLASY